MVFLNLYVHITGGTTFFWGDCYLCCKWRCPETLCSAYCPWSAEPWSVDHVKRPWKSPWFTTDSSKILLFSPLLTIYIHIYIWHYLCILYIYMYVYIYILFTCIYIYIYYLCALYIYIIYVYIYMIIYVCMSIDIKAVGMMFISVHILKSPELMVTHLVHRPVF